MRSRVLPTSRTHPSGGGREGAREGVPLEPPGSRATTLRGFMGRHPTAMLAALALALGACGGGNDAGDSSSAGGQTSSGTSAGSPGAAATGATGATDATGQLSAARRALVTRADKVCTKADVEVKKLNKRIRSLSAKSGKANAKQAADLYAKAVAINRQLVSDLSAIEPPAADASAYRSYLKTAREEVSLLAQAQRELAREDTTGFRIVTAQINASKQTARTIAQQFGFHVCGVG